MDIIVCVKAVLESLNPKMDKKTNTLIRDGSKSILNPFDTYAVEAALNIRETTEGQVTVISMGTKSAEAILRETIAMGADQGVLLNDSAFAGSDTLATSYILAKGIEHLKSFDLIICGRQSIDSDTAQVGPELAQKLSIPHITCVISIEKISAGKVRCKRVTDFGYEVVETVLPALITVVKGMNKPRAVRIKDKLRAQKCPVPVWNAEILKADKSKCGLEGSPTKVVKTYRLNQGSQCRMLDGSYVEQAKELIRFIGNDGTFLASPDQTVASQADSAPLPDKIQNHSSSEYRGVCLFAECENQKLSGVSRELLGTGKRLAKSLDVPLSVIILGENIYHNASFLAEHGADVVYMIDNPRLKEQQEELSVHIICEMIVKYKPEIMLFGATTYGKSLAPRVAAALETGLTADCTGLSVDKEKRLLLQTRPAAGNSLVATIICPEKRPQMATVRPHVMTDKIKKQSELGMIINEMSEITFTPKCKLIKTILEKNMEVSFHEAETIVSIGKGIGSAQNIPAAVALAKELGGTIGTTRALVDLGWMDYCCQIGQTGKTVNPQIYLAVGISGSLQHMVGMMNSKKIIAINHDPNAPIFEVADLGVVADASEFILAFMQELRHNKGSLL